MKKVAWFSTAAILAWLFCSIAPTAASPSGDVLTAFNTEMKAYNKGDVQAFMAGCAPSATAIDEFPPYVWQGSGACAQWWHSFEAWSKESDVRYGMGTLGTPMRVEVTGDRAYLVIPATFPYTDHGKAVTASGTFAVTMAKSGGRWLITAWAWARH
jgi:ketosteroid isomerase-like protein